jgi:hypothetical protein
MRAWPESAALTLSTGERSASARYSGAGSFVVSTLCRSAHSGMFQPAGK